MTTLAQDKVRNFRSDTPDEFSEIGVEASEIVYEGAAVGDNASGYAQPLEGGDVFLGFAYRKADNSAGSAGDVNVKIRNRGVVQLDVTGVADTDDVGETVYATDDDTFTLTASGGTAIGKILQYLGTPETTTCLVYFESATVQSL